MSAFRISPVRILRGEPTDDELAALIAVLARLAGTATSRPPVAHSGWGDPARQLRTWPRPGPGGWRGPSLLDIDIG